MKHILAIGLLLLVTTLLPVGIAYADQPEELTELRGRNYKVFDKGGGTYEYQFVGSPVFTEYNGQWVDYAFTVEDNHYKIQHPWSSSKFYDYYTEVWNEEFTEVKIYDDRWAVEYQNKKGAWVDADIYNITRSYERVSDGIKVKRTGSSDIGQREEIYFYRNASPCKIEIRQTCDEAQTIRFVWKPSGIVASSEKEIIVNELDHHAGKTSGLNYYDSDGNFVETIRWYDELDICDTIVPVVDTHAHGRKATITFGSFVIDAGGIASLDPETFYPDADPETSSVDGFAYEYAASGADWATIRAGAGSVADDSGTAIYLHTINSHTSSDKWEYLLRAILLFDVSGLPDGCTVTAATFSLHGDGKRDELSIDPDVNVYSSNPASDTAIVAGDFDSLGTTAYCDTPITYDGWSIVGYNDFIFNATGIAAVQAASDGNTVVKLGTRNANYDVSGDAPAWSNGGAGTDDSRIWCSSADAGGEVKPKLVVTYAVAPTVTTANATDVTHNSATLNGNITATGGENADLRGFEWGVSSGNYSANWTEGGSFSTGVFSRGISGLSANQTYYYRAMAHNSAGWGYGSEVSFTTSLPPPPGAPTGFTLTAVLDNQINATWDAVSGATTYLLLVSDSNYPTDPTGDDVIAYSGNATSTNMTGYNLDFSKYYFSLWTQTNPYSDDYTTAEIGGEALADEVASLVVIFRILAHFVPVILISVLGFWAKHPVLLLLAGAVAMFSGFYWYESFTTNLGLTTGLCLLVYGLVCISIAFRNMFRGKEKE